MTWWVHCRSVSSMDLHEFVRRGVQCGMRYSNVGTICMREERGIGGGRVSVGVGEWVVWGRGWVDLVERVEVLKGEKSNIPGVTLCWFVAVEGEEGELRVGESLAIMCCG